MKKLLKKLIKFLKKLFGAKEEESNPSGDASTPPNTPAPNPIPPPQVNGPEPIDPTGDPAHSNPNGQVQTFLWKPESDTNPQVSVIVVSADELRSDELKVEILDKNNKEIPGLIPDKNKYSNGRGNGLPGFKYERINYKPGLTDKQFKKFAPLKVKFYLKLASGRKDVKVLNKEFIIVKNPEERVDLK